MTLRSSVLVPDVPPAPQFSDISSPLVITVGVISVLTAVVFGVHVIRMILNVSRTRRPIAVTLTLAAIMLVTALATAGIDTIQRDAEQQERDEHWELEQAAEATVIGRLEESYGITFTDSMPIIPIRAAHAPREEDVRLPDGTETTCWIDIEDDHYALLCGGDSLETSTRLDPVTS
ncbi:hypothetical protein ACTHAM_001351 [Cellulomonas soli]|uniref:hypothetical protein n=1 Tax=Cellulomonas soli TaxID=931535 RepID=UPI003F868C8C